MDNQENTVILYPCIIGFKQFFSTSPAHWCRLQNGTYSAKVTDLQYGYITIENKVGVKGFTIKYYSIVYNNNDIPYDFSHYINALGEITDLNRFLIKHPVRSISNLYS